MVLPRLLLTGVVAPGRTLARWVPVSARSPVKGEVKVPFPFPRLYRLSSLPEF